MESAACDSSKKSSELNEVVLNNVETIRQIEDAAKAQRDRATRIADVIASFCGSITFVWVHIFLFGFWLTYNSVEFLPKNLQFDRPPFPVLTLIVSLEAIFLSTFILISQNRQQAVSDHRNHLDLQINLLSEQENSEMLRLLRAMSQQMGIDVKEDRLEALQEDVDALKLAEELDGSSQTIAKEVANTSSS